MDALCFYVEWILLEGYLDDVMIVVSIFAFRWRPVSVVSLSEWREM